MYIGRRRNPFIHLLETRSVKKYSNVSFFKIWSKKSRTQRMVMQTYRCEKKETKKETKKQSTGIRASPHS